VCVRARACMCVCVEGKREREVQRGLISVFMSMATVTGVLLHTNLNSAVNLESVSPVQFILLLCGSL
jgi:hypothetical protein